MSAAADDILTIARAAAQSDRFAMALPARAVRVLAAALLAAHGHDVPAVPGVHQSDSSKGDR